MMKIIKGKKYDTNTATMVAEYWNGLYKDNFGSITEKLYRKRTGEYFLHGSGGARTQYAQHSVGRIGCGEKIIPLSEHGAREWAEMHISSEEYEKVFGAIMEDEKRKDIHLVLATATIDKLRRLAVAKGITASAFIDNLIADIAE